VVGAGCTAGFAGTAGSLKKLVQSLLLQEMQQQNATKAKRRALVIGWRKQRSS
jgi:hypothetical protein